MAKAETDNNTEWILLGDCIEREFARVHSVRLADRLTRRYLEERRLKSRYLDADGNPHSGDELPKGFWVEAEISREEHSARLPERAEKVAPPDPVVAAAFARAREAENTLWRLYGFERAPDSPPRRPRMLPAIEIYCVKVKVWSVGPTPREELTAAAPEPAAPLELAVAEQSAQPQKAWRRGRPSSVELVLAEAERRLKAGEIPRAYKTFREELSDWLRVTHRESRQMAPKTVGDHFRKDERVRTLLPRAWLRRS